MVYGSAMSVAMNSRNFASVRTVALVLLVLDKYDSPALAGVSRHLNSATP